MITNLAVGGEISLGYSDCMQAYMRNTAQRVTCSKPNRLGAGRDAMRSLDGAQHIATSYAKHYVGDVD